MVVIGLIKDFMPCFTSLTMTVRSRLCRHAILIFNRNFCRFTEIIRRCQTDNLWSQGANFVLLRLLAHVHVSLNRFSLLSLLSVKYNPVFLLSSLSYVRIYQLCNNKITTSQKLLSLQMNRVVQVNAAPK